MVVDTAAITGEVQKILPRFSLVEQEVGKIIVGQKELIRSMLIGLLADGHLLLEGVPGLAKTLAVNTLAKTISCEFTRIQFTPDLLPADLTGTTIYNQASGTFTVKKGPVFTNILLADEINRAPPKVQSALLEVMQERQVTIGGETFKTAKPFLVLATQNPIEQEGTYVLPEAQTDRFLLKVLIDYPSLAEEKEIVRRMARLSGTPVVQPVISGDELLQARPVLDSIYVDDKITDYILAIVFATRNSEKVKPYIQYGASPRASLGLTLAGKAHAFLEGRGYVTPHDIKSVAHAVLRHRIRVSYEAESEGITSDQILDQILSSLVVP